MNKLFLSLLVILALPVAAQAATLSTDSMLAKDRVINDNYYVAAGNPTILGNVNGDLLVAGGNVIISGDVAQDLEVTGGNVTITGNVGGDLRVLAGSVLLSGQIAGDAVIAAGETNIESSAVVGRDLIVASGKATINAAAQVRGKKTVYEDTGAKGDAWKWDNDMKNEMMTGMIIAKIFSMLATLLTALILFAIFPAFLRAVSDEAADQKTMLKNFGIGLLFLLLTPILIIFIFITAIGYQVALILSALYFLAFLFAMVFAGIVLGRVLQKATTKKSTNGKKVKSELNWGWALGGVALLSLISLIPIVGWLVSLFFVLLALGAKLSVEWAMLRGYKA